MELGCSVSTKYRRRLRRMRQGKKQQRPLTRHRRYRGTNSIRLDSDTGRVELPTETVPANAHDIHARDLEAFSLMYAENRCRTTQSRRFCMAESPLSTCRVEHIRFLAVMSTVDCRQEVSSDPSPLWMARSSASIRLETSRCPRVGGQYPSAKPNLTEPVATTALLTIF